MIRWTVWAVVVVVWTWSLVYTIPPKASQTVDEWTFGRKYLVAKTLHVVGYAALAWLTGRLPGPRGAWMFFLCVHAVGTELIQMHFANRNGDLHDVGYDMIGIALGVAFGWKKWLQAPG